MNTVIVEVEVSDGLDECEKHVVCVKVDRSFIQRSSLMRPVSSLDG